VIWFPTPLRWTEPSRPAWTPGPATGAPLLVMAGHSALLSADGPVHEKCWPRIALTLMPQP